MQIDSIRIKELIQAGDRFLLKFNCPGCRTEHFEGYPLKGKCTRCQTDWAPYPLEFSRNRRLLCGTKRKRTLSVNKKLVRTLIELYGLKCSYCDLDLVQKEYHIDHIIPVSVGGTNDITNLTLSCPTCNLIAGAKCFNGYLEKRSYIQTVRKRRAA